MNKNKNKNKIVIYSIILLLITNLLTYLKLVETGRHKCKVVVEVEKEVVTIDQKKINEASIRYQSATDEQIMAYTQPFRLLRNYTPLIIATSKKYDIDPVYTMALIIQESGHMEKGSAVTHNNVSGIRKGEDYKYYDTLEESIIDTVRLTAEYAATMWEEPLNTVKSISEKWSESSKKTEQVVEIMKEIQTK